MKRLLLILTVWLVAISSYSQSPTLIGLHGTSNSNTANRLGAQVVRYGFADYKMKRAISGGDGIELIAKMMALDSLGIEQVVYLKWPDDTIEVLGVDLERIPVGADRAEVFRYLDTFLLAVGPYIEWIQISQEPLGVTKYDDTVYSMSEIAQWWRTVARFIRERQQAHPALLGHLRIASGGISGIRGALSTPNSPVGAVIDSIIEFGENYCDAIDLHLHTSSVVQGAAEIEYIRDRTNFPLICTEWSQSYAAVESGWLNNINTVWTDSTDLYFGRTNKQVIGSAYEEPMDSADWNALIATAPYTDDFIPDFYEVMDSNCFILACYGAVWQYGNPRFDWNHLIANKTVTQPMHQNNPFFTEYITLSSILNNGSYTTNCLTNSIENEISNQFIRIYPNPANAMIYVETGGKIYNAQIFDILGKHLTGHTVGPSTGINVDYLNNGVYFIKIWDSQQTKTLMFVKQ